MLGIAPKGFDTVDMLRTADKLIVTVMHSEMLRKAHVNQSLIAAPTLGIDDAIYRDMASDDLLQRDFRGIGDDFGIHFVTAFQNTKNDGFTARTATAFATNTLGTEIGFVQFHDTAQRCLSLAFFSQTPVQLQVQTVDASDTDSCQFGGIWIR